MGSGRWDAGNWSDYASQNVTGKSRAQVFTASAIKEDFDPRLIKVRESRDSDDNPASTPIILASDVTGSMGMVAHELMKTGLNTLATEIYDRRPVTDPHVMVMAIGDAKTDRSPVQATQFEADVRLADQVRDLWIEGNGGGNNGESYSLAHYFAATRTVTDSWEKRRKKGYLFTIGDEPVHDGLTGEEIARHFGHQVRGLSADECLSTAMQSWEVFHVVLENEGYARGGLERVLKTWSPLLPQRLIMLSDYTKLAETLVSVIQVAEGAHKADVAASWDRSTSLVVSGAIRDVAAAGRGGGAVRLA